MNVANPLRTGLLTDNVLFGMGFQSKNFNL